MSMCRAFSFWKRVFGMTSVFSWQSLWPASFCSPRSNLPVTPGFSWLPTFAFQSSMMKRTSFWGVHSRQPCRMVLHRTIQLQLLQHYCLGHKFGLLWYWMVCLGNEQSILLFLKLCASTALWTLLLTMMVTSFLLSDSCPHIMAIWVKFTHSSPF